MTAAERQRAYRDRKRGGPPRGRWPAWHKSLAVKAAEERTTRTLMFRVGWLLRWRPDLADRVMSGELWGREIHAAYRQAREEEGRRAALALRETIETDGEATP